MLSHPLFYTLKNLRGNARGCVYTEPLWGIPFNLYVPYVSVYMLALGLSDQQIGLIISIGMVFQVLSALLSGVITDKLGRKRATLIFDILAWSVPCLIWAVAQNFTYFLIAAMINGMWRITMNSWTCLLVEDTDPEQLVDIYSWIYIAGLVAAFFTPFTGLLIRNFSLIPTMRGLYLFAVVMMTVKFLAMNAQVTETHRGLARIHETKHQNYLAMLREYSGVLKQILRTRQTLYTAGIMLVISTCLMINNTFWSILVTEKLQIPAQNLALYPFVRSIVMLFFFFLVVPRIGRMPFRNPMLVGFAGFALSQLILIAIPEKNYLLLLVSTFLEAGSLATVSPLMDRMVVVTVDARERARIMAIIYVIVILITSPFGWIAGVLSDANRILPFVLNAGLFSVGGLLTVMAARTSPQDNDAREEALSAS